MKLEVFADSEEDCGKARCLRCGRCVAVDDFWVHIESCESGGIEKEK